jgi:pyridoxal phosphate enzyme (YggS family)
MTTIAENLQAVRRRIAQAAAAAGREADSVCLVAVSKTWPQQRIREAHQAGHSAFGENQEQEATQKIAQLSDLPLEWHFIGPIQSNKTRAIAEHFSWVHSVDRLKIAERFSAQRPGALPPLKVLIQVNVSSEPGKSGVEPAAALSLAQRIRELPQIELRGLMAIPRQTEDPAQQRSQFRVVRELLHQLTRSGVPLDTLSMGMSGDLEMAVAEGATMVRIGSAIFGARDKA